ncbi:MAG: ATP-binding protein, partial [Candidatus Binatia bacterium]
REWGPELLPPSLADLAHLVPDIRSRVPDAPAGIPRPDSAESRFRLFDATAELLRTVAVDDPLILILDDLQWADEPSLLLLEFLAETMRDSPLLMLGTHREIEARLSAPVAEHLRRVARHARRIELGGLSRDEIGDLIASRFTPRAPDEDDLIEVVHAVSGGNPFFADQILCRLTHEVRPGSARDLVPPKLSVPEGIRELVRWQTGLVSHECRRVLDVASVIGRSFAMTPTARASEVALERLPAILEEAIRAGLVLEEEGAPGRFRFVHDLTRESLYEDLAYDVRLSLHRRVGEALEEHRGGAPLAELARHFVRAAATGGSDKAVRYATAAGDHAIEQLAWEDAVRHYEQALEVARASGLDERCQADLLVRLGDARWSGGRFERSKEAHREAAELAERLRDAGLLARATIGFGGRFPNFDVGIVDEQVVGWLRKALAWLGDGNEALRAILMGRLAAELNLTLHHAEAAALAGDAVAISRRLDDREARAYVLVATLQATWGPDNLEERLAHASEIIGLADEVGDPRLAIDAHATRLTHLVESGDIDAAERELATLERRAEALRLPYARWVASCARAMKALLDGRFAESEALITRALEVGQESENRNASLCFGGQLFFLRREQGRLDELAPLVEGFLDQYPGMIVWRCALVWMLAEIGRDADARRELGAVAADDFRSLPRDPTWLVMMSALGEAAARLGDAERAGVLYELLLPYADRCPIASQTFCVGSASRLLGLLATVLGRFDDAGRHFEDAIATNRRMRALAWIAHTEEAYAAMLARRDAPGDRERAAGLARSALDSAEGLGMTALRERASALGERLREGGPAVAAPAARESAESIFRRETDYWLIAFEGESFRLRDARGLGYLAALLARPGLELSAVDLTGEAPDRASPARPEEHEDAERFGDRSTAAAERARQRVAQAIRRAVERIARQSPALAAHLRDTVRTGTLCSYRPGPRSGIRWQC